MDEQNVVITEETDVTTEPLIGQIELPELIAEIRC